MAITIPEAQQGKSSVSVTTLATTVFTTPPNVGDAVVVFYGTEGTSITHTAPTDSAGHTGTQIGTTQNQSGFSQLSAWIFENLSTGTGLSSYIVTAHWTSVGGTVIAVRIAGGLTPVSYNGDKVVNSATTVTTGANPTVGPTTVTPAANSVFFGALQSDNAADNAYTDGTGIAWTHITNETQPINSTADDLYVEHFIETAGSTAKQTATWTGVSGHYFNLVFSCAPAVATVAPGAFQQMTRPFPFAPGGASPRSSVGSL